MLSKVANSTAIAAERCGAEGFLLYTRSRFAEVAVIASACMKGDCVTDGAFCGAPEAR